jgi:hypothetical protein
VLLLLKTFVLRKHQPESSVTVVFPFLPCVAYKQAQDRFVVFSFRFRELESVKKLKINYIEIIFKCFGGGGGGGGGSVARKGTVQIYCIV